MKEGKSMKKAGDFCRLFMWGVIGGFIGRAISTYMFYRKNPGLLELTSAPWYAELINPLIVTAILVVIFVVVRIILKKVEGE